MMTRLTNNHIEFAEHIRNELSKPFSMDSCVVFSAFPSLGTGHFSIQLVDNSNPFLLVRQWNQDLGDSYALGIYNLDNVKIDEKKIKILDQDLFTIRDLIHADLGVKELKAIILDGVDFELRVIRQGQTNIYHWRTKAQISGKTNALIEKLVDVAGLQ
ncbi:MAG: hypothetical protein HOP30_14215 [Cyclobacteriaceae bacterium]|nr:hypothetical protein [Cyclobacteriaceae bacterium]